MTRSPASAQWCPIGTFYLFVRPVRLVGKESGSAQPWAQLCATILNSILKLYCLKYTPSVKKKRRYLIYYAISILTEKYDTKIEIIKDKELVETVVKKINSVYKQIKKNEIGPKVDYLMTDIRKSSLEKTIDKLQMINKYDYIMNEQ